MTLHTCNYMQIKLILVKHLHSDIFLYNIPLRNYFETELCFLTVHYYIRTYAEAESIPESSDTAGT